MRNEHVVVRRRRSCNKYHNKALKVLSLGNVICGLFSLDSFIIGFIMERSIFSKKSKFINKVHVLTTS